MVHAKVKHHVCKSLADLAFKTHSPLYVKQGMTADPGCFSFAALQTCLKVTMQLALHQGNYCSTSDPH